MYQHTEARMEKIGILHPGAMGISLAASALSSGQEVYWAAAGRSQATRARAAAHDLTDVITLSELSRLCSILISVCPPHAAEDLANQVLAVGYRGLYVDANAISPQRAMKIAEGMQAAGAGFVDGGIIGGPAWQPNQTCLYLSGMQALRVASCFSKGPLETSILGTEPGRASALKMCYASYSKGTTALLCAALAASEALGVRDALLLQWDQDEGGSGDRALQRVSRVTAKAWRFEGEMHEIADTLSQVGLPAGFHEAAAEVYHGLAEFKDAPDTPTVQAVLEALLQNKDAS
jgi:3-hydroxyisobutyrate dehydrogenase-like beta-hydroxyacid dehydrogenase